MHVCCFHHQSGLPLREGYERLESGLVEELANFELDRQNSVGQIHAAGGARWFCDSEECYFRHEGSACGEETAGCESVCELFELGNVVVEIADLLVHVVQNRGSRLSAGRRMLGHAES